MNKKKLSSEKQRVAKLALFGLLAGLSTSAGYALVSGGDSVLWAQIENALSVISPQAQASGESVTYDFPAGWTNSPNWHVIVTDCDCPPPPPPININRGGGDGGGGSGSN